MSGSVPVDLNARAGALAEAAAIRNRISALRSDVASGRITPEEILAHPTMAAYRFVSVLKAFECAPALGKTGARAVLQSAGVLHTTTIDELESGAIAKLERLLNDRKSEAK